MVDEELKDLILKCQAGSDEAYQEILKRNKGLIYNQLNKLNPRDRDIDDLVQEGRIGLWVAANSFDFSKGTKFSTYAYIHIRMRMSRYNSKNLFNLKCSDQSFYDSLHLHRFRTKFHEENGREPEDHEISCELGFNSQKILELKRLSTDEVSTDFLVGKEAHLADLLYDEKTHVEKDVIQMCEHEEICETLRQALDELDPKHRVVLMHHSGILGHENKSFKEISEMIQCHKNSAHAYYKTGFRKLSTILKKYQQETEQI